jgi:hypothetical protein
VEPGEEVRGGRGGCGKVEGSWTAECAGVSRVGAGEMGGAESARVEAVVAKKGRLVA